MRGIPSLRAWEDHVTCKFVEFVYPRAGSILQVRKTDHGIMHPHLHRHHVAGAVFAKRKAAEGTKQTLQVSPA